MAYNEDFGFLSLDELLEEVNSQDNKKTEKQEENKLNGILDFYKNQLDTPEEVQEVAQETPKKESAKKKISKEEAQKAANLLNKEGLKVIESGAAKRRPEKRGPFFKLADYIDKQAMKHSLKNAGIIGGAVAAGKVATDAALSAGLVGSAGAAAIAPGVMLTVGAVRGVLDLRKELKAQKDNKILSDLAKHEISNRQFPNVKEIKLIKSLREKAAKRGLDDAIRDKLDPFLAKGLDESKLPTEFVDQKGGLRPWAKFASRVALHAAVLGASAVAGPVAGVGVAGAAMLYKTGVLDKVYKLVTGKETERAKQKRLELEKLTPEQKKDKKRKLIGNTIFALGTTTAACILGGQLGEQLDIKGAEMGKALDVPVTAQDTKEAFNNLDNSPVADHDVTNVSGHEGADLDGSQDTVVDAPHMYDVPVETTETIKDYLGDDYFNQTQNATFTMSGTGVHSIHLQNFNPDNPNDVLDLMINDRETFNQIVENQKSMNEMLEGFDNAHQSPTLEDVAGEAIAREASVLSRVNPDLSPDEALKLAIHNRINMYTDVSEAPAHIVGNEVAHDAAEAAHPPVAAPAAHQDTVAPEVHNASVQHQPAVNAKEVVPEAQPAENNPSVLDRIRNANDKVRDMAGDGTQTGRDVGGRVGAAERIGRDWNLGGGENLGDAKDAVNTATRASRGVTMTSGGVDKTLDGVEDMQNGEYANGARKVADGVENTARGVDKTIRTVTGNKSGLGDIIDNATKGSRTISNLKQIFGRGR